MGVPRGVDNFKDYRNDEVNSSVRLISAVLTQIRKRKFRYQNLSALVNDVAERTRIHRTTLKRNPKYHKELLDFLASQPGASAMVPDDEATAPLLRAKLFDIRLELKNTSTELLVTKAKLTASTGQAETESTLTTRSETDWYLAFSETASLLRLVLERVNSEYEVMKVDIESGEILDIAAAKGRQLVADGSRTHAFLQFYRKLLIQEGKLKEDANGQLGIPKRA